MLPLRLSHQSQKFLKKLPPKQAQQVAQKIQSLREDPYPTDHKKLREYKPFLRADIGEYRIIYRTEDDILWIIICGKRNDDQVYKLLDRKLR